MGAPTRTAQQHDASPGATPSAGEQRFPAAWHTRRLHHLRLPRRPRFWFELGLVLLSYWAYSLVRNVAPARESAAQSNADLIWQLERAMGLAFERAVNHACDGVTWLIVAMNYYYATLHFVVTIAVLVWLFRRHPGRYAAARLVLFATTGVALLGYYLFPLAPPRLMDDGGFIDTVVEHGTWGSMASGDLAEMSNQYAAMPSMHIGWSLWCGITIAALARRPWLRALGALYPAFTLLVIVATANHFWLDAVGGVLCLGLGYLVSRLWYGRLPHRLPRWATATTGPAAAPAEAASASPAIGTATPATPDSEQPTEATEPDAAKPAGAPAPRVPADRAIAETEPPGGADQASAQPAP